MAQSRLERIGTIYSRITNLVRAGAKKEIDKPLWFSIYEAFPPKYEPRFDRVPPTTPIRPIFYEEDVIRGKFQKEQKLSYINLLNPSEPSDTQKFLTIYQQLLKEGEPKETCYDKAVETFFATHSKQGPVKTSYVSQNKPLVDLKELF